jgi:hypothetical protein
MQTKMDLAITLQETYLMHAQIPTVIQPVATSLDARMQMVTDGQTKSTTLSTTFHSGTTVMVMDLEIHSSDSKVMLVQ